jgi:hypothetical protein
MRGAECIHLPVALLLMGYEGANADDRVIDVLGKLITHSSANFIVASAFVAIGCGIAF